MTFVQGPLKLNSFKHDFLRNHRASRSQISYGVPQGKMKDYISDDQDHMTKMPLPLYMVKTLNNLVLQNLMVDYIET